MQRTYTSLLSSLYGEQQFSIRDPLWKDIRLPVSFKPIIGDPVFQKLGRIKQLGPAFHLYPGAVHTRLDHSLGVYHVGFLILSSLLKQAMHGKSVLPCTEEGMKTFLCACLLHDIGHFPFAHSLKELPLKSHEAIADSLIRQQGSLYKAIRQAGIQGEQVGLIIDERLPCDDKEIELYRNILSGTLDPDKLDYLNRDAFFCGVPYGTQDVSYITDQLTVVDTKLAVSEQAMGSVEHLLFSKYLMYRNVYWHKTTRSATAMIKKAILLSFADGSLDGEDLYGLDDEQFFLLPSSNASLFAAVR
ncbi:HD domain-containing protein, partial [Sphaerochaeta sp.]